MCELMSSQKVPSTNIQDPEKIQAPRSMGRATLADSCLVFGSSLDVGAWMFFSRVSINQVKERIEINPHDVHEVPVQSGDFDGRVIISREPATTGDPGDD